METHVLTFTITKSFAEWVATYDASLPLQKIAGITSLYRGVSKDDPRKVCAVMQAAPGVMVNVRTWVSIDQNNSLGGRYHQRSSSSSATVGIR